MFGVKSRSQEEYEGIREEMQPENCSAAEERGDFNQLIGTSAIDDVASETLRRKHRLSDLQKATV